MPDRSLVSIAAAGFRSLTSKAAVSATSFGGAWRELSGVGFVREPFAGAWQRNMEIEAAPGLTSFSPVYACVTRIASDIAKLELVLRAAEDDGVLDPAAKTSPFWTVLRKPNSYQNRIQFIRYWLICKLLWGNAYAIKVRDQRGIVQSLYLVNPRLVTPLVTPIGDVYYSIAGDQLARIPNGLGAAPASEVIHDRGPTLWHPLVGIPPLYACALSGTLGLQIQRNSAAFFGNMSRPSGILTTAGEIDQATADRYKQQWNENLARGNLGRLAVLGNGLKYEVITQNAEQSQLAEQFGLAAVDVARAFGMPSYKINEGQMPTSNNVAALNQQYYSDCLQTYIEDLELCLDEGLEVPPDYSIEFDLDGLMRMDPATQMDVLAKGVGGTILTPNEARQKTNRRGIAGGDTLYLQQQNYSTAALAKRDASDDPFASSKTAAPSSAPAAPPAAAPAPPPAKDAGEALVGIADLLRVVREDAAAARADATAQSSVLIAAAKALLDRVAAPPAPPAPAAEAAIDLESDDIVKSLSDAFAELEPVLIDG
jgi:HK97 family phage portal protein